MRVLSSSQPEHVHLCRGGAGQICASGVGLPVRSSTAAGALRAVGALLEAGVVEHRLEPLREEVAWRRDGMRAGAGRHGAGGDGGEGCTALMKLPDGEYLHSPANGVGEPTMHWSPSQWG